jgi:acyl-coenzyme A synthetase/AMP-(fatty) acid ligase/acyl carrier protein
VHTSFAFDLALTGLFTPLVTGGCVELMGQTDAVEQLAHRLQEGASYSLLKLTPTHLRALADLLDGQTTAGAADYLVVGGEALLGEHVEFWKRRFPCSVVVNEYGPTEAAVGCCIDAIPLKQIEHGPVPIGKPVPGTRLYVLNRSLQPVPVGVAAELYIGGAQVVRGYVGRPGLTAECFVPDPFAADTSRMYRTGDRVRWQKDGKMEWLGRMDNQVKVRGMRVEPGEVESIVAGEANVREVRVIVREDVPGDKRLVAYVVGDIDTVRLREHLSARLPDYMVPTAFVAMDRLPFTANGKLDVEVLPPPVFTGSGDTYVPPQTGVEEVLAGIWISVLGAARVGTSDNFFDLGGHSLLIMKLIARIRSDFGLEFSMRTVFSNPTLHGMAAEIERKIYEEIAAMPEEEASRLFEVDPTEDA